MIEGYAGWALIAGLDIGTDILALMVLASIRAAVVLPTPRGPQRKE